MPGGTSSSQPFSQSSERQEGKCNAVEVIPDHEIERESRTREVLLLPVSVRALRCAEIVCRPAGSQIFSVSCGHVREERPSRLRRRPEILWATPGRTRIRAASA